MSMDEVIILYCDEKIGDGDCGARIVTPFSGPMLARAWAEDYNWSSTNEDWPRDICPVHHA